MFVVFDAIVVHPVSGVVLLVLTCQAASPPASCNVILNVSPYVILSLATIDGSVLSDHPAYSVVFDVLSQFLTLFPSFV